MVIQKRLSIKGTNNLFESFKNIESDFKKRIEGGDVTCSPSFFHTTGYH